MFYPLKFDSLIEGCIRKPQKTLGECSMVRVRAHSINRVLADFARMATHVRTNAHIFSPPEQRNTHASQSHLESSGPRQRRLHANRTPAIIKMPVASETVVFKTIGCLKLELNVYWREHSRGAPVLIYFHGNGSPLQGSRWDIPQHMYDGISKWKYTLVSADYRLAPHRKSVSRKFSRTPKTASSSSAIPKVLLRHSLRIPWTRRVLQCLVVAAAAT